MEGRREAARAVWRWQEPVAAQRVNATHLARRHGLLRAGLGLAAAAALATAGWHSVAWVAAGIAFTLGVLALASPTGAYAMVQRLMERFALLVGQVITVALLVPIYWLVFTPFGLLTRHGDRDPLHRTWPASATTFWTDRAVNTDTAERRKRPF